MTLTHDGEGMWFFEFSEEMRNVQSTLYDIQMSIRASPSKAERRLGSIIERHPYAFDAYDRLAYILYYVHGQRKETLDLLEKGLTNAKELFQQGFTFGKSSLPWGILENRPFFRMYKTLGIVLKEGAETERAKEVFEDIVGMNPDDDQGMRELLCSCYFGLGDNQSVLELCRKYEDDGMAAITFGRVLALFKLGRTDEARKALREAVKYGANIAKELMANKHDKLKDRFSSYESGSKREAELYWDEFGSYWDATAVRFVREQATKRGSVDR
ncbi:MAG: transcriptional repressor TCF25 family protein [Nitrososphaerales archaeon]